MEDQKDFFLLRYTLVEDGQRDLHAESIPTPKGRAVLRAVIPDRDFQYNASTFSFVGFSPTRPVDPYRFEENRYYVGKLAKLKRAELGEKVPGDVVPHIEDNWTASLVILDTVKQYLLVQKNWEFGTPEHLVNSLEVGIRKPMADIFSHRTFIEGMTRKGAFWEVIEAHNRIYQIRLTLFSPNILEANRKARESMAQLKEVFGQDETEIALKNEAGELKAPESYLQDYLDYIADAEGSWLITTEGERGKKDHSSKELTISLTLNVPTQTVIDDRKSQADLYTERAPSDRERSDAALVAQAVDFLRSNNLD